jgi:hypothetical protein
MGRAEPRKRAPISTAKEQDEEQDEMRAFRPKSFRQQAAAQQAASDASRGDGLTGEQHKAMMAEFDRRIMSFKEQWRVCRNGNCRRRRQCLGPPFACNANGRTSRWSKRQYWRLRLDIIRNPPQV